MKKTRQNKKLEPRSASIGTAKALASATIRAAPMVGNTYARLTISWGGRFCGSSVGAHFLKIALTFGLLIVATTLESFGAATIRTGNPSDRLSEAIPIGAID